MAIQNRLHFIQLFLNGLNNLVPRVGNAPSSVFEVCCYTIKLMEFRNRGVNVFPQNIIGNLFSPHLNPGIPHNASYYRLEVPKGDAFNLF